MNDIEIIENVFQKHWTGRLGEESRFYIQDKRVKVESWPYKAPERITIRFYSFKEFLSEGYCLKTPRKFRHNERQRLLQIFQSRKELRFNLHPLRVDIEKRIQNNKGRTLRLQIVEDIMLLTEDKAIIGAYRVLDFESGLMGDLRSIEARSKVVW